jgi:hypothetical protein
MARFEELDPFYVKTLDEHRELNRLVSEIERKLTARLSSGECTGPDWTELPQLFKVLLIHLEMHFKEEEAGGLLEEVVCRLPRLAAQATALERQHEPLLQQLRPIAEKAQSCGSSPERWEQVAREFHHFVRTLIVHEGAENRLAEEAFKGGSDSLECGNDAYCATPLTPALACGDPASEQGANSPRNRAQRSICGDRRTPASNLQSNKEGDLRHGGGGNEHSGK